MTTVGSNAPDGTVVGYVPGAWDMFHIGHLNILLRAREMCDRLIVGVVTDEELLRVKGRAPIVPLDERREVVAAIDVVDLVLTDYSTNKIDAWRRLRFNILFKGDDWRGTPKGDRLEEQMASVGVSVRYFAYTAHTSSTQMRRMISSLTT